MNLKSDETVAFQGVLWSTRGPWFTLRNVSALRSPGGPTRMDGDLVVHRDNVAFFQVVP